jgi:tRNA pseudouridine55 synthase
MNSDYHGVLLVNKPLAMTSHDAVDEVRRAVGQRRVGHCGTLDPLADGLLVICVGSATKIARHLTGCQKTYQAEIYLGMVSETYDSEGLDETQTAQPVPPMSPGELDKILDVFRGTIVQMVPAYSAVHVNGERLHRLARRGQAVTRPERQVQVHSLIVDSFVSPSLRLTITCSSGTYIRSIAHDIGQLLGCGAYLKGLRRQAVGRFLLDDAMSLREVRQHHDDSSLSDRMLRVDQALDLSAIVVTDDFASKILQGRALQPDDVATIDGTFEAGEEILLKSEQGLALAVGLAGVSSADLEQTEAALFEYRRVLN